MPDFQKLGKVIDNKVKQFSSSSIKINSSLLDNLQIEEKELYTKLGQAVYENEKDMEQSCYDYILAEIKDKKKFIEEELRKFKGSICLKCGAPLSTDAVFCSSCGEKVVNIEVQPQKKCSGCGAPIKPEAKFCVICGIRFSVEDK